MTTEADSKQSSLAIRHMSSKRCERKSSIFNFLSKLLKDKSLSEIVVK